MNKSGSIEGIVPQRFLPFDIGISIDQGAKKKIENYFLTNEYEVKPISGLLKCISADVLLKVNLQENLVVYIFSYGVGVFVIKDQEFYGDEKYAVDYCEYRKNEHKKILEFRKMGISGVVGRIINDLRELLKNKKTPLRLSASSNWEYGGLSYVMTVSYIIKHERPGCDYKELSEMQQKNLQIMLQPSLAHKEDTMALSEAEVSADFNPYNFDVLKLPNPTNWIKSEDCSIYISWAAVVVCIKEYAGKYVDLIECMEVDLQAMWLYTYCQYVNLKFRSSQKLSTSELKKEKFHFQRKYNEFKSNDDSSVPVYMVEIRNELIATSGIDEQKKEYVEYLDYCIDETESYEAEQQRKYSVLNEILLFIIAFIQIAPMLYDFMIGEYQDIVIWPVIVLVLIVLIAIWLIIRKD